VGEDAKQGCGETIARRVRYILRPAAGSCLFREGQSVVHL